MKKVDILKNGNVFCSKKKTFTEKDIYISNGNIIDATDVSQVDQIKEWDAEADYISPGFIDLHVHVFENQGKIGINADKVGINQGVTTLVDAGSVGYKNFKDFRENIIKKSKTEVLALLNIAGSGLVDGLNELTNPKDLMSVDTWKTIKNSESSIVGLKARISQSVVGNEGIRPLEHARQLADQTDVPLMVHIGSPPPPLEEIFPRLRKGDIATHAFHGKSGGILDGNGVLIPAVQNALNRGVKLDVGHGTASFSYTTLQRFKRNYNYPFTISTDIYNKNFTEPVGSLMDTMSKLFALGYPLENLLQSVTSLPASILSLSGYGNLNPGSKADITVFCIDAKESLLFDSYGEKMVVNQRLIPKATWKNGKLVYQRG